MHRVNRKTVKILKIKKIFSLEKIKQQPMGYQGSGYCSGEGLGNNFFEIPRNKKLKGQKVGYPEYWG